MVGQPSTGKCVTCKQRVDLIDKDGQRVVKQHSVMSGPNAGPCSGSHQKPK